MKKRFLSTLALISVTAFGLVGTVLGTISWFVASVTTPEYKLNGSSAGAYFAYGDGSEDRPYGISIPRHLYNLSWLQYMGQFSDGQYYFELAESLPDTGLDMTGYVLPPIGTENNPFVGNFNGRGKVITNLTVSNDQSEIFNSTKHPDATQVNFQAPEIVGLFGVVGNYNDAYSGTYESATNTIYDLGINGITVKTTSNKALVGVAAGYVDATVSNVAVNESTIDIGASSTAAVDSTNLTSNLSDYGVVGYATEEYKKSIKTIEQDLYDVNVVENNEFNASEDGDAQGWGGSINMKTIYNRIVSLSKTKSTDVSGSGDGSMSWRTERTFYNNEEALPATTHNAIGTANAYARYVGKNETGHEYIGNYNVFARNVYTNGYYGTNDYATYGYQQYLYLSGGHYENRTYRTYYEHTGKYITDGNGNYLTYNNNALTNVTNAADALLWTFTQYSGNQYYISTSYNGTTHYLYYNSGSLGTATSTGTTRRWTVTENGNNLTISYNTSKIYYYNDEWTLISTTDQQVVDYYTISSGNNYISNTVRTGRQNVTNTTAVNSAAHFQVEDGTNYVYMMSGNTKYYLTFYRYGRNTFYLNFNTDPDANNYYPIEYNGTYLRAEYDGGWETTYYYPRFNNNAWSITTTDYDILPEATYKTEYFSTMNLSNTFKDADINKNGPDYYQTSADATKSTNESHMYYTAEDTTYFPLNVNSDTANYISNTNTMNSEISSGNLDPKDSNTGYIISGSNITSNLTTLSSNNSNIRISRYAISNVSASYDGSDGYTTTIDDLPNSSLYTINTSGTDQTMEDALSANANLYPRFKDSKTSFFQNSLASSTDGTTYTANKYVYGLHFMDSTINTDSIVEAEKVSVLGNKCDKYQFPVDAIDFNLKQKGVINFFAGTYFSGNNSFFSLHEIVRNDDAVIKGNPENKEYTSFNTINDIKEIEEIYSNDVGEKTTKYANIYKYKGKTGNNMYSVPYRIDGNQNKFVMNKDSTAESQEAYTYATMGQSDFEAYCATYGYTLKFKTSQIGAQNSTYTTNRIYYFEFPMNPGEYCLGSVTGGTGAYLLYLDIGANAAKTQRTIMYEHFKEIKKVFEYPAGVAIVSTSTVSDNISSGTSLDETNTANFLIVAGTNGTITVTRSENDVEVARSGGLLTSAKPTLVGELMWDSEHLQYNIHDPGGDNLTSEITSQNTVTEVRRLQYYDYNVNLDELTITHIIDTSTDNGESWERAFYQEYADGTSTTELSEMKIYNTNGGTKYSEEDLSNPSSSSVKTYSEESGVNTNLIFAITYAEDNGENVTHEWKLEMAIDEDATGRYYMFGDYVFAATLDNGEVTITVVSLGSKTIKINNTTITQAGQTVTIQP